MNDETQSIQETYLYGYPIVGMYALLYEQVKDGENVTGFHSFLHTASLSTPKTSFVPAPNNDTSYSRAWLDLSQGPVVIHVPDMEDRYYSIQLLDLFSETIANVGRRTTGTKETSFILTGPTYHGEVPKNGIHIACSTVYVLAFLRILIHDEKDISVVEALQSSIYIDYFEKDTTSSDVTNHLPEYKNSTFSEFFSTLCKVLMLTPLPKNEEKLIISATRYRTFTNEELKTECERAIKRIEDGGLRFGENINHWRIAKKGIGKYGSDYLQRAVVWHKGALANVPEESLYPSTFQDSNGEYLNGKQPYTLTFPKGELPPVSQFWSLTMYRFSDALLVDNPIDCYSIGDRTNGLHYGEDGSLTIYLSHTRPKNEKAQANWLPAPQEGFYVTLRLYGAEKSALNGTWAPPEIQPATECSFE